MRQITLITAVGGTYCPTLTRGDFLFLLRHLICDEILQLAPAGAFNLQVRCYQNIVVARR